MSEKVITPVGRLAYPALFVPTAMNDQQEKKYSATIIFPADADLTQLKKAALEVALEKWGDKATAMLKNKQLRSPFRDCTEKEGKQGFVPGGTFITARSAQQPGVVDSALQPIIDPSSIYGGLLVRLSIRPFTYDNSGNKGISFSLQNVLIVKDDGTRWDGRATPEDDFAGFRSAEAATAGVSAKTSEDVFG